MIIIGCDFHTRFQQIATLDPTTGEIVERRLEHEPGEAERFYASLPDSARVGVEATIRAQWFEKVLARYGHDFGSWWTWGGSNPRPPRCERGALPAELHAHRCFVSLANARKAAKPDYASRSALPQPVHRMVTLNPARRPASVRVDCN
jgi:hypothetical protein